MVGRPPKPTALKIIEGDTRKYGANKHAGDIATKGDLPPGLPDAPKGLGPLAREHWKYITGVAGAEKLFREADAGTLSGLCQMYEGFMQQSAIAAEMSKQALNKKLKVEERGRMADRAEAARKLAEKLYGRYLNGADRLGLSPAARARLQLGPNEEKRRPFGVLPPPDEWKQRKPGVSA